MKKLILSAVVLFSAVCANAQSELAVENQYPGDAKAVAQYEKAIEKQDNPKTSALRKTWLANTPNAGWFISGQAGVGGSLRDGNNVDIAKPWGAWGDDNGFWNPVYGGSVGKWISPVWGLRLNGLYGTAKTFNDNDALSTSADYVNVTGDFLLNLKNFFMPYNPKAFFNPVLYLGTGFMYTMEDSDLDLPSYFNLATKLGLQFNFRLGDRWQLFLEGQGVLAPKNFDRNHSAYFANCDLMTNVNLGLTYRFNFRHFIAAPMYDQREIDALNREIEELRNRPVPVCPPVVVCPEPVVKEVAQEVTLDPVFFLINSAAVRDNQLISVAKAAQYLMENPNAKIEIAGYADKNTGTPKYNMQLSEKRAKAVAKMLTDKFGVEKSRIKTSFYGDTVQPFAENDWNRVAIFVK